MGQWFVNLECKYVFVEKPFSTEQHVWGLQTHINMFLTFVLHLESLLTSKRLSCVRCTAHYQIWKVLQKFRRTLFEASAICVTDKTAHCFQIQCMDRLPMRKSEVEHVPNTVAIFTVLIHLLQWLHLLTSGWFHFRMCITILSFLKVLSTTEYTTVISNNSKSG